MLIDVSTIQAQLKGEAGRGTSHVQPFSLPSSSGNLVVNNGQKQVVCQERAEVTNLLQTGIPVPPLSYGTYTVYLGTSNIYEVKENQRFVMCIMTGPDAGYCESFIPNEELPSGTPLTELT